jgi:hypothetical protein
MYAAAEAAREAWGAASDRVRSAEPATLTGVVARLEFLTDEGQFDFETAVGVLRGIAERNPGLALA